MASRLFEEFDEVSAKAWKQKIQYDLKGADYNNTLVWESPEGIKVKPFYHSEDLKKRQRSNLRTSSPWKIGQKIFTADAKTSNLRALDILQKGAESLVFEITSEEIKIDKLLRNIDLNLVPVHFDLRFLSSEYVDQLLDFQQKSTGQFHINLDIIGHLARSGNWFYNLQKDHEILEHIVSRFSHIEPNTAISVDAAIYQNAGANMVQQLAYALAHANEYLNHGLVKIDHGIVFKMAVGSNYFFEIAKLRAMRILWKSLSSEYGLTRNCQIVATPSRRNKTLYDYNVNMLRTTSECMSAILGGADTIVNLPYDEIYHRYNEFGTRIARNQLLILKNESYFDNVANPTDGSYYIETLTSQLAEKALTLFKDIEASGGFLKQLKNHTIQKKIRESAKKEQDLIDGEKEILIGSNKYQNLNDLMKNDIELNPFVRTNKRKTLIEPILEKRLAEKMEQKRLVDE
ncbi:methylmalonyl-CoA mutase subunit beta [Maribacter algicola]|uniref:Methylmalonyl-CoA mutase subunit beta n=1 Tax=Meishania litoralis TaxID=3434685 RepID=A0ACC7LJY4_9FLAO